MSEQVTFTENETAVWYRSDSNAELVTVEKVYKKQIACKTHTGKAVRFTYGREWDYQNLKKIKDAYERYSEGELMKLTEKSQSFIEKTAARAVREANARENEKLCKASDQAEADAFFASDEGKVYCDLHERWIGADIRSEVFTNHDGRSARVELVIENRRVVDIDVYQRTDSNWETREYILKEAEFGWSSIGTQNVDRAAKYMELMAKAKSIAETWNKDTGKFWDKEARTPVAEVN